MARTTIVIFLCWVMLLPGTVDHTKPCVTATLSQSHGLRRFLYWENTAHQTFPQKNLGRICRRSCADPRGQLDSCKVYEPVPLDGLRANCAQPASLPSFVCHQSHLITTSNDLLQCYQQLALLCTCTRCVCVCVCACACVCMDSCARVCARVSVCMLAAVDAGASRVNLLVCDEQTGRQNMPVSHTAQHYDCRICPWVGCIASRSSCSRTMSTALQGWHSWLVLVGCHFLHIWAVFCRVQLRIG
jgi:hypothetical protein